MHCASKVPFPSGFLVDALQAIRVHALRGQDHLFPGGYLAGALQTIQVHPPRLQFNFFPAASCQVHCKQFECHAI
jgi:hypothetical protein